MLVEVHICSLIVYHYMTSEWFACLILYIFCPAQILLEQHLIEVKFGKTADTRFSKIQTLVVLLYKKKKRKKKRSHFEPKEYCKNVVNVLKGMFQFSTGCRTASEECCWLVHCLLIRQFVSVLCVSKHTHVQNCPSYGSLGKMLQRTCELVLFLKHLF